MLHLCLIRHGESLWNPERRLQGQTDVPLSDVGIRQAAATAQRLASQPFDALYSSDLTRAWDTAQTIARGRSQTVVPLIGLRERHFGKFQSLNQEEANAAHPAAYARFRAREADYAPAGGGESLADFTVRVMASVQPLIQKHKEGHVLLVTHGGVLDVLHRHATGKPQNTPRDFTIPNAAINWLDVDTQTGAWSIRVWADEAHLSQSLDELPG